MVWLSANAFDAQDLEQRIKGRVEEHLQKGHYTGDEVHNVVHRPLDLLGDMTGTHGPLLTHLRSLSGLWDLKFDPRRLDSAKPWVGPPLGLLKRLLFRVFRFVILPAMEQQTEFNRVLVKIQKAQLKALLALEAQRSSESSSISDPSEKRSPR